MQAIGLALVIYKTVVVHMTKILNKNFIPILISILLIVVSIFLVLFNDYSINYIHYLGIVLVAVSGFLFFKSKMAYAIVFMITLFLGLLNVLDILVIGFTMTIGPVQFNPIFLAIFILFFVMSKEELNRLFPEKEKLD